MKKMPKEWLSEEEINFTGEQTMKNMLKYFKLETKVVDEKNHIVDAVISTNQVDRDNEIIETEAWRKNLVNYLQHPVLLSSHNYRELTMQIGQAKNIAIGDNNVTARFEYYVGKGNKEADWGWELAKKNMAMFSVGFKPTKWVGGYGNDEEVPDKYEKDGKKPDRVFTEVELLEVSQVLVGSNRGALQLGIEQPNIEQSQYMYDVVKNFGDKIPDFEQKAEPPKQELLIKCSKCKKDFDFNKQPEVTAGIVQCPDCKSLFNQKGEVKGQNSEIDTSGIILPFKFDVKNIKEAEHIFGILKSGRVISEKNRKLINNAVADMETAITSLKVLAEATEEKPPAEPPKSADDKSGEIVKALNELLVKLSSSKETK